MVRGFHPKFAFGNQSKKKPGRANAGSAQNQHTSMGRRGRETEMGAAACALTRFAWRRVMSRAPSLQLSADADVMLAAVRCDASLLKYAATALRADREFILAAVQQDASCLRYASTELRADREVVLAAVKKDRHALEFAAPALLKAERKLVSAAVHQDTTYLKYAPLRADVYVILDAMQMRRREREDLKEQADDLIRRRAVEESRRELLQRAPREQHPAGIAFFKAMDAMTEQKARDEQDAWDWLITRPGFERHSMSMIDIEWSTPWSQSISLD